MKPDEAIVYVGTPTHDATLCLEYVAGLLQTALRFNGRFVTEAIVCSYLPRGRDTLLAMFLATTATHYLSVDSDIAWGPGDLEKLLELDKPFVSGVYVRKDGKKTPTIRLAEGETWSNERLLRASHVPGGFFLMTREAIEEMWSRYLPNAYELEDGRRVVGVHGSVPENGRYENEDVAFCRRWREIGGEIWVDPRVKLAHVGRHIYRP